MKSPAKVMVVAEDPQVLRGVIWDLEHVPGITIVSETLNANEALAVVEETHPDVIIFDPRHIESNATQFLRNLAVVAPGARIVVYTTCLTEFEQADLILAGVETIVFKEIDSSALVRAIAPS